jgi:tetratricopeptide (TPR) repeat protein
MLKHLNPTELAAAQQRDAQANGRLLRGLELLETNTPTSLHEAVQCFDDAIALRRELPLAENSWFRYGLIAGWMNKGDALTRLGSADELRKALRCYDEALSQLRELPMHESPLFIKRLAIAWLNRGFTLMKYWMPGSISEAERSFGEATAAARNFISRNPTEGVALLAGALMNHANALIQHSLPEADKAIASVKEALKLCRDTERGDAMVAEIAFKARHILCRTLADQLTRNGLAADHRGALLAEASDIVDEGMALARDWEARGVTRFRPLATDLFRFGCRVYQTHQPHFLTEFLLENLDPALSDGAFTNSLLMHASARDALWRSLGEFQRDGFKAINTPRFTELLAHLRELRVTEARLTQLCQAVPGN